MLTQATAQSAEADAVTAAISGSQSTKEVHRQDVAQNADADETPAAVSAALNDEVPADEIMRQNMRAEEVGEAELGLPVASVSQDSQPTADYEISRIILNEWD